MSALLVQHGAAAPGPRSYKRGEHNLCQCRATFNALACRIAAPGHAAARIPSAFLAPLGGLGRSAAAVLAMCQAPVGFTLDLKFDA